MSDGNRVAALVIGGLFLGIWLWIAMVEDPDWAGWGALGLAFAGALYAGRLANEVVRTVTWVALGIALGLMFTAALLQESVDMFATVLTFTGGALIVSSLPVPGVSPQHQD